MKTPEDSSAYKILSLQNEVLAEIDSLYVEMPDSLRKALLSQKGHYLVNQYSFLCELHGNATEGNEAINTALNIGRKTLDTLLLLRCLHSQSHYLFIEGQTDTSVSLRKKAAELALAMGDTTEAFRTYRPMFKMLYEANRYQDAADLIAHSLPFAAKATDEEGRPTKGHIYICYKHAARALFKLGQYDSVASIIDSIDSFSRTHGIPHSQIDYLHLVSDLQMARGNYNEAISLCHNTLKRSEKLGWKIGIFRSHQRLAFMKEILGEPGAAKNHYLKALPYADQQPYGSKKICFYADAGAFMLRIGEIDSSVVFLDKAYELNRNYQPPLVHVIIKYAEALYSKGHYNNARKKFIEAQVRASRDMQLRIKVFLAKIHWQRGNRLSALQMAKEAYNNIPEISDKPTIELAQLTVAEMAGEMNEPELAFQAHRQYVATRDSLQSEANQKAAIHQAYRYNYETQALADSIEFAKQKEINDLKLERELSRNALLAQGNRSKNLQLVLLALALIAVACIAFLIRQKRRRDQLISFQKAEVLTLKAREEQQYREIAEKDLHQVRTDLKESINQLMLHQKRNTELKEMLEELRSSAGNTVVETKTKIIQRKLGHFLVQDHLEEIREKAARAYPYFYAYLEEKLSTKSKTEILYCIMLFSGYAHNDISRILQRSDKAIRSLRYRIRKKLGLGENEGLEEFLSKKAA